MNKNEILTSKIFFGLENLNNGFDANSIFYFSEADFLTVLNRVKLNGFGIYGIEPWKDGEYFDVLTYEDYNKSPKCSEWYFTAFKKFADLKIELMYSATYLIND